MEFNENKAIFLQIADLIFKKILAGEWMPSERIPAVRELAVALEVNPNTVMRTYQYLEKMNVINVKRGTGFYLTENAKQEVFTAMKTDFINNSLPELFDNMALLKVKPDEIKEMYEKFLIHSKYAKQ